MDKLEKIREQLIDALRAGFKVNSSPSSAEDIAAAIEALINEKLADLRDEINQRGIYDPEW